MQRMCREMFCNNYGQTSFLLVFLRHKRRKTEGYHVIPVIISNNGMITGDFNKYLTIKQIRTFFYYKCRIQSYQYIFGLKRKSARVKCRFCFSQRCEAWLKSLGFNRFALQQQHMKFGLKILAGYDENIFRSLNQQSTQHTINQI